MGSTLTSAPLQSLADSGLFSGDALDWLLGLLVSATGGEAIFGVFAGGVLYLVFYIAAEGDIAVPTTVLILTSTVFVAMVPEQYGSLSAGVAIIGVAAVTFGAIQRYVLSGAAQ